LTLTPINSRSHAVLMPSTSLYCQKGASTGHPKGGYHHDRSIASRNAHRALRLTRPDRVNDRSKILRYSAGRFIRLRIARSFKNRPARLPPPYYLAVSESHDDFAVVSGRPVRARRAGPSARPGLDPLTLLNRRGGPYPGPGPARARSCAEPPWPGCALAGAIHAKESLGRVPLPRAMAPALPPEPVRSTPARFEAHRCSGRRWRLFPTPSLRRTERLDHDGRGLPRCPGSVHGAPPPARLTWRTGGAPLFAARPALHAGGSGPNGAASVVPLQAPGDAFPIEGAVPVWCAPRSREAGEGSLLSRHGAFSDHTRGRSGTSNTLAKSSRTVPSRHGPVPSPTTAAPRRCRPFSDSASRPSSTSSRPEASQICTAPGAAPHAVFNHSPRGRLQALPARCVLREARLSRGVSQVRTCTQWLQSAAPGDPVPNNPASTSSCCGEYQALARRPFSGSTNGAAPGILLTRPDTIPPLPAWRGAFLWFSAPAAKVAAGLHGNPIERVKEA